MANAMNDGYPPLGAVAFLRATGMVGAERSHRAGDHSIAGPSVPYLQFNPPGSAAPAFARIAAVDRASRTTASHSTSAKDVFEEGGESLTARAVLVKRGIVDRELHAERRGMVDQRRNERRELRDVGPTGLG